MTGQIVQSGVVCAIGIGPSQCSASFRAGLSGYSQSSVLARDSEPIVMALVPEVHVEALHPDLLTRDLRDRERRMLRLGGMALAQLQSKSGAALERGLPLFLALPEPKSGQRSHGERGFLDHLAQQAEVHFDLSRSQCFENGRAGGLFALRAAIAALAAGREEVLVGGIDSCLDLAWLSQLEAERRLLRPDARDGFVPGEAAAILLLSRSPARSGEGHTKVVSVGTAEDPGHRYSDAPALGSGLATALDSAWTSAGSLPPVKTCFSGLNGESFGAKEWGIAHIRHHDRFAADLAFEHPADCFGDVGAAMGPLLLALADETLRNQQRPGPMLVWASSDRAPVACALLSS